MKDLKIFAKAVDDKAKAQIQGGGLRWQDV